MSGFYTYELFGWRLSVMRPHVLKMCCGRYEMVH